MQLENLAMTKALHAHSNVSFVLISFQAGQLTRNNLMPNFRKKNIEFSE